MVKFFVAVVFVVVVTNLHSEEKLVSIINSDGFELNVQNEGITPCATTSSEDKFPGYNKVLGNELASVINKPAYCSVTKSVVNCGSNGSSKGCCYSCVASASGSHPGALSRGLSSLGGRAMWPVGVANELNTGSYARSFADYFIPERHEKVTKLKAAYLRGKKSTRSLINLSDRHNLPTGSVIVWSRCNGRSSSAGHIAIIDKYGRACSDFCHNIDACNANNIIGMFYPKY